MKKVNSNIGTNKAIGINTARGTNAEMLGLTPFENLVFFNEDDKCYYYANGVSWNKGLTAGGSFNLWRGQYANNSAETTTVSYAVVSELIFGGTDMLGTPTEFLALLEMTFGALNIDIKIFDVTNALTIVEKLGNVVGTPTIVDLGALANLSTGQAIWEIQLRRTGGTGSATSVIHSFQIK